MSGKTDEFVTKITRRSDDFSQWYVEIIQEADLADYSTIKGCMVIKPYGYSLWENIRDSLDERIRETGHQNAYFPLLVPESMLQKEATHIKGFAPEVAWVTHGGGEQLEERMAIRPTSEAIIGSMFARWIQSYRDLPLLINQWANVVRWEKVTRLFLRTTEFLWQEGHTAHRREEEAEAESLRMLDVYREFSETELAIPVITGKKTEAEKFAGALSTYTVEALMGDGRALQMGTSHNLGQHFARVFEIKYLDEDQKEKYVWQTSWGLSTRVIGAVVMVHGDDYGLILPPRLAPLQTVIIPIYFDKNREEILQNAQKIYQRLKSDFRVELDSRDEYTPGWKFNEWEMRGVPVRIELGPRDCHSGQVVIVRRDKREKYLVKQTELSFRLKEVLGMIQQNLFTKAQDFLKGNTHNVNDYQVFKEIMETGRGIIKAYWCSDPLCEEKIKAETTATIRCIPFERPSKKGKCIYCGSESEVEVYFAKAY